MQHGEQSVGEGGYLFPSTIWTEVLQAGRPNTKASEEALNALLTKYARPLKGHLMWRFGVSEEEAADLLHEFVHLKILQKHLLSRAVRNKGSFRGFICESLRNFVTDYYRDQNSQKRRPEGGWVSMEEVQWGVAEPSTKDPSTGAWAEEILNQAIRLFRSECERSGRRRVWQLFEARLVGPLLHGGEVPSYTALVEQLKFASPGAAYKALTEARQLFQQCLERVVGEIAPEDVRGEIQSLRHELTGRNSSRFRI